MLSQNLVSVRFGLLVPAKQLVGMIGFFTSQVIGREDTFRNDL